MKIGSKIIVFIVLQICAITIASAQQKEFPYLNNSQVVGVFNIGNEAVAISLIDYRTLDNTDIYIVSYLNDSQNQIELLANHGSKFVGVSTNNGHTYFVFDLPQLGIIQVAHLNQDNQITYASYSPEEKENFRGNPVGMETNELGNLFVYRTYAILGKNAKGKTIVVEKGAEVLSYDSNLNQTGLYRNIGDGRIIGANGIKEGVVLTYEAKNLKEKAYHLGLIMLSNSAQEIGQHELTADGSFFPSEIISYDNQIVLAGYSMKNTIFNSKTEGLFIRVLNMDGTVQNTSLFSWEKLKSELKNKGRGDFIFNGKKTILVEQIIPVDKGFKLICESYSSNSGVTVGETILGESGDKRNVISIFDFVIFDTNESGELTAVNILEKEPMNIEVAGSRYAGLRGLALEKMLKRYKVMPFKSIDDNTISFINYVNQVGTIAEMDITTGVIKQGLTIALEPEFVEEKTLADERIEKSGILTKLDNMDKKMDNMDKKVDEIANKVAYGLEKIDYFFNPYGKNELGYHTLDNGKTIVYVYYPTRYSIFYEVLN